MQIKINIFQNKILQKCGYFTALFLTSVPIFRTILFLKNVGGDNPSNDDLVIIPVISKVLEGNYDWLNYFRDTFFNGHVQAIPTFIQIVLACLSYWNLHVVLYFGVAIAFLILLFLYDALTCLIQKPFKLILLPILSALIFSSSQIIYFEFEYVTITNGLCLLGFVLGLWGLVRFRENWLGIIFMITGGILASWSTASGPLVWPVFFIGLLLLNFRKKYHYLVWFLGALVASAPYIYFLFFHRPPDIYPFVEQRPPDWKLINSLFNPSYFLMAIGWPFTLQNSTELALQRGWIGFVLSILGLGILFKKRNKQILLQSAPSLMLIMYGLLFMQQIGMFRGNLGGWYVTPFMYFWFGLISLTFVIWLNRKNENQKKKVVSPSTVIGFSSFVIVVLGCFYFTSNISYADKSFYIKTRSPSSSSCLRNYKEAPTYCEQSLFLWSPGQFQLISQMANPLEKHHLTVFSPHQTWALQGDFIFDNVHVHETPGIPDVFWSSDLTSKSVSFSDFHHLNLFLHTPNSVDWTVFLPKNLIRADFHTAIAISQSAPSDPTSDGVGFEIIIEIEGKPPQTIFNRIVSADQRKWQDIVIPLEQFAGERITIKLSSNMRGNILHDWAMFRYPYIDLSLNPNNYKNDAEGSNIKPSNTDLSPLITQPTTDDEVFNVGDFNLWETIGIKKDKGNLDSNIATVTQRPPSLEYKQPLNICISDYTHLLLSLAASSNIYPRVAHVTLQIDGNPETKKDILIPLLPDEQRHQYTYDLKLLELPQQSRLKGIRFEPIGKGETSGEDKIQIKDLRLIRGGAPTFCH